MLCTAIARGRGYLLVLIVDLVHTYIHTMTIVLTRLARLGQAEPGAAASEGNHVNLDMRDRLIGENSRMAGILHYLPACSTQQRLLPARTLYNAILRNNEKNILRSNQKCREIMPFCSSLLCSLLSQLIVKIYTAYHHTFQISRTWNQTKKIQSLFERQNLHIQVVLCANFTSNSNTPTQSHFKMMVTIGTYLKIFCTYLQFFLFINNAMQEILRITSKQDQVQHIFGTMQQAMYLNISGEIRKCHFIQGEEREGW